MYKIKENFEFSASTNYDQWLQTQMEEGNEKF